MVVGGFQCFFNVFVIVFGWFSMVSHRFWWGLNGLWWFLVVLGFFGWFSMVFGCGFCWFLAGFLWLMIVFGDFHCF